MSRIAKYIESFVNFAEDNPDKLFYVTAFGTGLAGYSIQQIKDQFPPFEELPYNISFTKDWFT